MKRVLKISEAKVTVMLNNLLVWDFGMQVKIFLEFLSVSLVWSSKIQQTLHHINYLQLISHYICQEILSLFMVVSHLSKEFLKLKLRLQLGWTQLIHGSRFKIWHTKIKMVNMSAIWVKQVLLKFLCSQALNQVTKA